MLTQVNFPFSETKGDTTEEQTHQKLKTEKETKTTDVYENKWYLFSKRQNKQETYKDNFHGKKKHR